MLIPLKELFRLDQDMDREAAVAAIKDSVVFNGTNVWSLILAIVIASIGLNLNSTAVIIGAMLVSPLMGPITGVGLALAAYDLRLLRTALVNLAIMTVISLLASTFYFWLSPLDETTSELLARTTPTFYDVLVAVAGGAALMVGLTRKIKSSNILAGVAIATALMPPLCTAGYGLASRDWSVFFGAFYLYLLNSVFIGLVTYLFSKALKLQIPDEGKGIDAGKIRKRHWLLTIVAFLVFISPSLILGYQIVKETAWKNALIRYQKANFNFPESQVLGTKLVQESDSKILEVSLVGKPLSADLKAHLTAQLTQFDLKDLKLKFIFNQTGAAESETKGTAPAADFHPDKLTREAMIAFPGLVQLIFSSTGTEGSGQSLDWLILARWTTVTNPGEETRLQIYLTERLGTARFKIMSEFLAPPAVLLNSGR